MTQQGIVKIFGSTLVATLLVAGGTAVARDAQHQRGAHAPRTTQPHTRTTERQRTDNGHTRTDTVTRADGATASRNAVVTNDKEAGTRTRSVDSVATKTDDGFTRSSTATNPQGETATRDLTVSRDKEAGTTTRSANYTTFDGREGSRSDVIQRTDDGYTRDTTRTLPGGETHTRSVDVSCEKDAGKCVKQVETGQQP